MSEVTRLTAPFKYAERVCRKRLMTPGRPHVDENLAKAYAIVADDLAHEAEFIERVNASSAYCLPRSSVEQNDSEQNANANGFVDCPAINAATEEYFAEEDLFGQWLAEECDVEAGNKYKTANSGELFASWKAYLTRMGQDLTPWNSTSFGLEMAKHAEKTRDSRGIKWSGIRLIKKPSYFDEH